MTRKKRMRNGRQSLRGMHFGMAAADLALSGSAGNAARQRYGSYGVSDQTRICWNPASSAQISFTNRPGGGEAGRTAFR